VALDQAPPPLFRNGPTPLARLSFYVTLSLALFVLDLRFHALEGLRQALFHVADPIRQVAQTPVRMLRDGSEYFTALETLQSENAALRTARLETAAALARLPELAAENERLRQILKLRASEATSGQAARILYTARDPFSRRVYLDKGANDGLVAGQPVMDADGLIGQVTRIFPAAAEVTLITDKNLTLPVRSARTGLRSFVSGLGDGTVALRYVPANADIQPGDLLTTSGLDGVYPSGFPVARVQAVERGSGNAFAEIIARPVAAVENHSIVMVLEPLQLPPAPETAAPAPPKPRRLRGR
jgi:rod shape-determining protein MreC